MELHDLPLEIVAEILSKLSSKESFNSREVCKRFHSAFLSFQSKYKYFKIHSVQIGRRNDVNQIIIKKKFNSTATLVDAALALSIMKNSKVDTIQVDVDDELCELLDSWALRRSKMIVNKLIIRDILAVSIERLWRFVEVLVSKFSRGVQISFDVKDIWPVFSNIYFDNVVEVRVRGATVQNGNVLSRIGNNLKTLYFEKLCPLATNTIINVISRIEEWVVFINSTTLGAFQQKLQATISSITELNLNRYIVHGLQSLTLLVIVKRIGSDVIIKLKM
ncbi:unnamed protein product [Caenorhabditis auriculariae]|uniref:F-box domain-containing protein n=1 Tax=Caenorhabditis auriculariae TaxID=2777116 RepID=A0A8S1HB06_9PELO|nr:unnamed protein product [Caenorhabditis auriculariae]